MRVNFVDNPGDFESLLPEWSGLERECGRANPFIGPAFAWAWWRALGIRDSANKLNILLARTEQGLIAGLLPLYKSRGGVLMPLGAPWHNDCWDLLCHTAHARSVAMAFAAHLIQERRWRGIRLSNVPENSPAMRIFMAEVHKQGLHVRVSNAPPCMPVKTEGLSSPDRLLGKSSLPRIVRQSMRRMAEDGLEPVFSLERPTAELAERITGFDKANSMGMEKKTSFFSRPGADDFVRLLVEKEEPGRFLTGLLHLNNELASYVFCFDTPDEIQMYFTGTDKRLGHCRPGVVLTWNMLQYCMDKGKKAYNFLLGGEEYKYRWKAIPAQQKTWRVYNRSITSFLLSLYESRKTRPYGERELQSVQDRQAILAELDL